ncbi:MAG: DegV family protein [Acidimicrobiales bacterium]
MPGVAVITDSSCDLTPEICEQRGLQVVPLTIRFGNEEFVDREQLSNKEFWDRATTGTAMPETAAPSPGSFVSAFTDAAEAGSGSVFCVTLSSGLSATYQSACTAAEQVADRIEVRVVDSQSVTVGLGMLAIAALDLADDGAGLDAIEAEVSDLRRRSRVYGVLGGLDFLKRGGRIGGAAHLMGSLLSIKPVIEVRNGVVEVESKQRTRQRALEYLAGKAVEAGPLTRLAVATGMADDIGEVLRILEKANCEHEVVVSELGPVIGAHAGPGTVGVCFQLAS